MAYNINYEYKRSIRIIIEELLILKKNNKIKFYDMVSQIKHDMGIDFYDKNIKELVED